MNIWSKLKKARNLLVLRACYTSCPSDNSQTRQKKKKKRKKIH